MWKRDRASEPRSKARRGAAQRPGRMGRNVQVHPCTPWDVLDARKNPLGAARPLWEDSFCTGCRSIGRLIRPGSDTSRRIPAIFLSTCSSHDPVPAVPTLPRRFRDLSFATAADRRRVLPSERVLELHIPCRLMGVRRLSPDSRHRRCAIRVRGSARCPAGRCYSGVSRRVVTGLEPVVAESGCTWCAKESTNRRAAPARRRAKRR